MFSVAIVWKKGLDGEGGGREGQDGEHMYSHGWFIWMYGKNHLKNKIK